MHVAPRPGRWPTSCDLLNRSSAYAAAPAAAAATWSARLARASSCAAAASSWPYRSAQAHSTSVAAARSGAARAAAADFDSRAARALAPGRVGRGGVKVGALGRRG
jgi:hypothetical protein